MRYAARLEAMFEALVDIAIADQIAIWQEQQPPVPIDDLADLVRQLSDLVGRRVKPS